MNVVSFWKKESGNLLSHKGGLSQDQVAFLQQLKEGDRLVIWVERGAEGTMPNAKLKLFKPKAEV